MVDKTFILKENSEEIRKKNYGCRDKRMLLRIVCWCGLARLFNGCQQWCAWCRLSRRWHDEGGDACIV